MNIAKRIESFKNNADWLSEIMGGLYRSVPYLIQAKFDSSCIGYGKFREYSLCFRKQDLSALREVLIEQEYSFLKPFITTNFDVTILDIGAHIGTFALWCLSENQKAAIFSIEADPETYEILSQNRKSTTEKGCNWKSLNRAAWKNDELISFSNTGDSMSHKVCLKGTIQVQGIDLSEIFLESTYETVDLMKLDIEGAEESFLFANPELLSRVNILVIEIHPNLCNEENVRSLLKTYFPFIEDIQGRKSSKPLLLCRKQS